MISMLCGREGQFTVQVGSKIMSWHTIRAVSVPPSKKRGYRCVQIFPRSTIPAETPPVDRHDHRNRDDAVAQILQLQRVRILAPRESR